MENQILIKIPDKYALTEELVKEIQLFNMDLKIGATDENKLVVGELDFKFEDYEWVELKFPMCIFPDSNFDELYDINEKELQFEQSGYHSIILLIGVSAFIGHYHASLRTTIYNWSENGKMGRIYGVYAEYEFSESLGKIEYRMTDISFISYEKAPEEVQKSWQTRIPIPPTLSIEIVSAPKALKAALNKMANVWINYGTDLGVVICPYSKRYFVFESGVEGYTEHSIYTLFTHPLLPAYEGDFSKYVDEIE